MTKKEMRQHATLLCDMSIHEPWTVLRAAIIDFGRKCKAGGPHYSEESVRSLREYVLELESKVASLESPSPEQEKEQ